ncbi:MAG: Csa1 family protein, partial [Clostridium sp.]|uniref:Csa1 family protein n=1 Tax=Clostridium sp. TaxID=1506 RepID=UPI003F3E447B
YNEKGIHFIEEIKDEDVINKFDKFKLLFEVVSIDRKYLSTLEVQKTYYNKEVPLYGIKYKLLEDDENLNRIKKAYPEFEIEQEEVNLQLEGSGDPHNTHGDQRLIIELNKEDGIYLDASYSFNESEFSKELFKNN